MMGLLKSGHDTNRAKFTRHFLAMFFGVTLATLVAVVPSSLASDVGTLKGVIKDKSTNEPLVGASVSIVGTDLGAITDADGYYVIRQAPPGVYDLEVSTVGYVTVSVRGVKIFADQTAEQNVKLSGEAVELEKVVIEATTDVIQKNIVGNVTQYQKEQIQRKPVTTVDDLIKTASGVTRTDNGQILIRGGRAGEVAYIVDGVNVRDPVGGGSASNVRNISLVSGALQEIQIIKEAVDPEYQSLSGVVKISSQTGSPNKTAVMARFITDDFGNKSLNKYSTNLDDVTFTVSGPDPIFRSKILPALGIDYFENKELTYFLYGQVIKDDGSYNPFDYVEGSPNRHLDNLNILGIRIPERLNNTYSFDGNIMFKPRGNLKFILSYKRTEDKFQNFSWLYRYTPGTATLSLQKLDLVSLRATHTINPKFNYEVILSYRRNELEFGPQDPSRPGRVIAPDQYLQQEMWEAITADRDSNGVYTPPEPVINTVPDTVRYGEGLAGPRYTFGELGQGYQDIQSGRIIGNTGLRNDTLNIGDFTFNDNIYLDEFEGEFFADLNGNGQWDRGDDFRDTNGNGVYDGGRRDVYGLDEPEPYRDGDVSLGEPFVDVNRNGVYDQGIDDFITSAGPENQDLNRNSEYDGTDPSSWTKEIPYIDVNGNGVFDRPNQVYDQGEFFVDLNGNGRYNGDDNFLDPGGYADDIAWHHHVSSTYRVEARGSYQANKAHELKVGGEFRTDQFDNADITRPYLGYTGRPDGGAYPLVGSTRDFFAYKPFGGTLYFRDKMEYGQMIALIGLRWDFFIQSDGLLDVALDDEFTGDSVIQGDRQKFSPRIGFSYPISDKATVFFNYGHYYQLPAYEYLFARNTNSAESSSPLGNFNLDYEKTIQYSFGVRYALANNYQLSVAGYYKDEFDKINQGDLRFGAIRRSQYQNVDYGRSRGFELGINRYGGLVNGEINYTYAFAYGKASQTNPEYLNDLQFSRQSLTEHPLNDDIRHTAKVAIQLVIPKDKPARLFGIPIINDWTLSLEGVFETGRPFNPTRDYPNLILPQGQEPDENSLRKPSRLYFDLRYEKPFKIASVSYRAIVWVENVFDNKYVRTVYGETGLAWTQQVATNQVFGPSLDDPNPLFYDSGREVRLGIQMNL